MKGKVIAAKPKWEDPKGWVDDLMKELARDRPAEDCGDT